MYVPFYFKNNYYSRHYPVSYLLVLPPQWILKLNKTLIPLPFDLSIPRSSHFHSDISHFIIKTKNVAVRTVSVKGETVVTFQVENISSKQ